MEEDQYIKLLEKPYGWDILQEERALFLELSEIYGQEKVLMLWKNYLSAGHSKSGFNFAYWLHLKESRI